MGDVGEVHARAHDVVERGAGLLQRVLDVAQRLDRLGVRVAHADDAAVRPGGGRARHVHHGPDPHRAGVAHDRLPRRATRDVVSRHVTLSARSGSLYEPKRGVGMYTERATPRPSGPVQTPAHVLARKVWAAFAFTFVLSRILVFLIRSEEHTSELQSLAYLVCRLLLEKKKKIMREKVYIKKI